MEISNCDFQTMIFVIFDTTQQCVRNLSSLFEDEAPSKTMVYEWFAESNHERPTFDDDVREGRPCTSVVAKEVDAVREMISRSTCDI
jgi:hypothetical protein